MSRSLAARRLHVLNQLVRINSAIATEHKRLSQIEAKLAALSQGKKVA
jgi:hypothetical protein